MLWIIYMDDLLVDLSKLLGINNTFAYADDLLVIAETKDILGKAVELIQSWARNNKMNINYGMNKTAVMKIEKGFSQKRNDEAPKK